MSSLAGKTLLSTYTSLLKLEGDTQALVAGGGTAIQIKTGDNEVTPIYLNTDRVGIANSAPSTTLEVSGSFAASGTSGTFGTLPVTDTTPSVSAGNLWKTHASSQTLTTFDNGTPGQIIIVISTAAVVFAISGNLQAGSTNITTASGDVTTWVYDGTNWYLLSWMDDSENLSGAGGF